MTLAFDRVRFVMTEPSHPGNVGSAARAIKTMGFMELALVAPRTGEISAQPEAIALASGAADVLDAAILYPTLADALARNHIRGAALDVYVGEFEHTPPSRLWLSCGTPRARGTCARSAAKYHIIYHI